MDKKIKKIIYIVLAVFVLLITNMATFYLCYRYFDLEAGTRRDKSHLGKDYKDLIKTQYKAKTTYYLRDGRTVIIEADDESIVEKP